MSDQTDTLTGIIVCSTLVKNILFFPCSSRFLDMSEKQTKQNYRTLWVAILYTVTFFFVFFFLNRKRIYFEVVVFALGGLPYIAPQPIASRAAMIRYTWYQYEYMSVCRCQPPILNWRCVVHGW